MAVDTRDKRMSLICLSLPFGRVLPDPDGGFTTSAERAQLNYLYAFGADAPAAPFNPVWATNVNRHIGPVIQP